MKHTATMALMLTLGVAGVYAQQIPVNMTFSGDGTPSVIDLKHPNTITSEENLAGSGSQGPFTFRLVRASTAAPQPSTTCSGPTKVYFPNVAGAGLFRFFDGSLLMVNLTDGGDCIDFAANQAHVYSDLPSHRRNRPFPGGHRRPDLYRDVDAHIERCFEQPRLFYGDRGV